MDSILNSIKKMLGGELNGTFFDPDLIIHINSAFTTLSQLGIGPKEGFFITSSEDEWSDFISDINQQEWVKTYVYLKVKLVFDPPLNASVLESIKQIISEYEWRMNVRVESDLKSEE